MLCNFPQIQYKLFLFISNEQYLEGWNTFRNINQKDRNKKHFSYPSSYIRIPLWSQIYPGIYDLTPKTPKLNQSFPSTYPNCSSFYIVLILLISLEKWRLKSTNETEYKFPIHGKGFYTQGFIYDPPILLECCRKKHFGAQAAFNPTHTLTQSDNFSRSQA